MVPHESINHCVEERLRRMFKKNSHRGHCECNHEMLRETQCGRIGSGKAHTAEAIFSKQLRPLRILQLGVEYTYLSRLIVLRAKRHRTYCLSQSLELVDLSCLLPIDRTRHFDTHDAANDIRHDDDDIPEFAANMTRTT